MKVNKIEYLKGTNIICSGPCVFVEKKEPIMSAQL